MAHDIYMRFDNKQGPCTEKGYEGWVRIHYYTHALEQPMEGSAVGAGATSAARVRNGDFVILKDVDSLSPLLSIYCAAGILADEVIVELCESQNYRAPFMEYRMSKVLVRMIRPQLNSVEDIGSETVAKEAIHLRSQRIQWKFTNNDASGTPLPIAGAPPTNFGFDFNTNQPLGL